MKTIEFKYPDGTAQVYSAYDKSTVMLHFKWMQEYGIDGAFMQRFVGEVIDNPDGKDHFDKVLASAMDGSDQYQRAIAVMYDLGGYNPARFEKVVADAQAIYDTYASKRKYYLHENGKPLIALWGVGFNPAERGYSNEDIQKLSDKLKEVGYSIMLGVSTYWRAGGGDTYTPGRASLHALIKSVDVIMPWYVGRFNDINSYNTGGSDGGFANMVGKDIEWCKNVNESGESKVQYAPHCYVVYNPKNEKISYSDMNGIGRSTENTVFMAKNKVTAPTDGWCKSEKELGITFEGIDDDLETDYYLWLTGQAGKMLRKQIALQETQPKR